MYVVNVSHSKLDSYRECPYKYFVRYHEHLPEVSTNTALQFGSYIHKIFELGSECKTLDELREIAKTERTNYKFDADYEPKIDQCLKNFFEFNKKLSLSETLGKELKEEFLIDDIHYTGIIDRVLKAPDGTILVLDYKTGKNEKTKLELAKDNQLIGYAAIVNKKYGTKFSDIICAHYYPITGHFVSVKFTNMHVMGLIKEVKNLVWEIRKKTKNSFFPNKNKFCDWCSYKYACILFNSPQKVQQILEENKKNGSTNKQPN